MKAIPMKWMLNVATTGLCLLVMTACGPSEKQLAAQAEATRIDCLDKICAGDVAPKFDHMNEALLKLNGQWYLGPLEYFTSSGPRGFIWWKQKPMTTVESQPPELEALIKDGKGYDFSIEIFLGTPKEAAPQKSMYQTLLEIEKKGLLLEKQTLRSGLQVWRTRENNRLETWFVATSLKKPTGDLPTIACRGDDPINYRCTGGFRLSPDVVASMRFRAVHGSDWPEIYAETTRILNLLKKV